MAVTTPGLYLLDTNTISYIANGHSPASRRRFYQLARHHRIATTAIAEGEILYGLARKPEATRVRAAVESLFSMLSILPWDSAAAHSYGQLRAQLSAACKPLSTMDTLIAAHAVATNAILVTHDAAFRQVKSLRSVDWATDL